MLSFVFDGCISTTRRLALVYISRIRRSRYKKNIGRSVLTSSLLVRTACIVFFCVAGFESAKGATANVVFTQVAPFPVRVVRESWKSPAWPYTNYFLYTMEWRPQLGGNSPVVRYRIQQGVQSLWGFEYVFSPAVVVPAATTSFRNSVWLYRTNGSGRRIFRVTAIRQNGREFLVGESFVTDP
jgi:hypothetical protein